MQTRKAGLKSNFRFAPAQSEQGTNVGGVLQALQDRDEMKEVVVGRIVDPAFDGDSVVYSRSDTSIIQSLKG